MQKDQTQIATEANSIILETVRNVETSGTMALKGLKEAHKVALAAYTKAEAAQTRMRNILVADDEDKLKSLYAVYDKLSAATMEARNKESRLENFIYQLEEEQRIKITRAQIKAREATVQ